MYHIRSFILCFSFLHLHYKSLNVNKIAEIIEDNKILRSKESANINVELNLIKKDLNIVTTITEQFLAQFSHRRISFNLSLKEIFKICLKLDYIMIKIKLINYLKYCLNKFNV